MRQLLVVAALCSAWSGLPAQILGPGGRPDPNHPDLYAWYAAGQGVNGVPVPVDGMPVTRWDDLSAGAHHLVRTDGDPRRRPTFRLDVGGGRTAVEFDGDDYLWADRAGEFGTLAGPKTVFFAARVRSADGGYVFDGTTSGGRNAVFTGQSSDPSRWHTYAGGAAHFGPFVDHDAFGVHAVVFDGSRQEHFLNGQSIYSGAGSVASLEGLTVGARYSQNQELVGDLAELIVYRRALAPAERQAVEGYLRGVHPPETPPALPSDVSVFVGGDGRYHTYRIPSLLRSSAGTLLAFAEGRAGRGDHNQNDIVLRRSVDGGRSWGMLSVLHDDGVNSLNNPCAVQLRDGPNAGRILVMYQRFPAGCHVTCVVPGHTGNSICRSFIIHSDDDGLTWSLPRDITAQVKRPTVATAVASGPGIGIQLRRGAHVGRVMFPFNQRDQGTGHWWNYAVISDDGGATWSYGALCDDSNTPGQGNEVQFVERGDGSVLLNSRSNGGTKHRKVAVSTDGGATWSPMDEDGKLIEPQCMGSVLRFTDPLDGFRSRILYAGPHSRRSRVHGAVKLSHDEGATWSAGRVIHTGFYAYSCLANVDDRHVGCLFEADDYARIAFSRFTIEWLSAGRDCLGNGAHGRTFGSGCAGSGGWVPLLTASGCPTPGGEVALQLQQGPGGAPAILAFGLGRGNVPLPGCALLTDPLLGTSAMFTLAGTGAGMGVYDFRIPLPATLLPMTATVQGLCLDPGSAGGLAASNGYELAIF